MSEQNRIQHEDTAHHYINSLGLYMILNEMNIQKINCYFFMLQDYFVMYFIENNLNE